MGKKKKKATRKKATKRKASSKAAPKKQAEPRLTDAPSYRATWDGGQGPWCSTAEQAVQSAPGYCIIETRHRG